MRSCGGSLDAANRVVEFANRLGGVAGGVFDTDAGQATGDSGINGGPDVLGSLAVAVLEVTVDRQAAHRREERGMSHVLVAADGVDAVESTQCRREGRRGGCNGGESGFLEEQGRRGVPGVGHDERLGAAMEFEELFVAGVLRRVRRCDGLSSFCGLTGRSMRAWVPAAHPPPWGPFTRPE
nr:hypothetical protein [Amycolatopsis sp. DSM 110486]